MKEILKTMDELLEKECYIIDIFPEKVPENSNGQFFDVEDYLLNSEKYNAIKDKFVNIVLKLMCYYHMAIVKDGLIDKPSPEQVENAVNEIVVNQKAVLNCLFQEENMLLVFDRDCLNLSIYNPSKETHNLFEKLARSEGLFWRLSE